MQYPNIGSTQTSDTTNDAQNEDNTQNCNDVDMDDNPNDVENAASPPMDITSEEMARKRRLVQELRILSKRPRIEFIITHDNCDDDYFVRLHNKITEIKRSMAEFKGRKLNLEKKYSEHIQNNMTGF